jgi:hypothetical protein
VSGGIRTSVTAFGLSVTPPTGFEVAIFRRQPGPGQKTYAILHAATVPLPPTRGDFGSGVVELLGPDDLFVSVLEFGPESVGTPLFDGIRGVPGVTPDAYRPQQLQRTILGQAGVQRFFSAAGRAFCLYSVIGSVTNRVPLSARANKIIGSLRIQPS